jgi:hypothetical protein
MPRIFLQELLKRQVSAPQQMDGGISRSFLTLVGALELVCLLRVGGTRTGQNQHEQCQ